MTQEDKQLLLKDLCGRLPYGVKVLQSGNEHTLNSVDMRALAFDYSCAIPIPYLRPMNTMTEEELKEFQAFHCVDGLHPYFYYHMCSLPNLENMFSWLNEYHFDFRRLISKGLALEAPEGMYKTE